MYIIVSNCEKSYFSKAILSFLMNTTEKYSSLCSIEKKKKSVHIFSKTSLPLPHGALFGLQVSQNLQQASEIK